MNDEIPEKHNPVVKGAGAFEHTAFLIMQVSFCNLILLFFHFILYFTYSLLKVRELRRQNEDLKSVLHFFKMETKSLLRNMNTNVQKLYSATATTPNVATIENGQNQGRGM